MINHTGTNAHHGSLNERNRYGALKWRIIALLIVTSLLPLLIISFGAWAVFGKNMHENAEKHLQTIVRDHAQTIELFLAERLMALDLIANSYSQKQIINPGQLQTIFDNLNKSYSNAFFDLGVIDELGRHQSYVGPYRLLDSNYQKAFWFEKVKKSGRYISNVFLGHRNAPHFILSVKKKEQKGAFWILRATVNPKVFTTLVSKGRLGKTGECFILDSDGRYQTPSITGTPIFSKSGIKMPFPYSDLRTTSIQTGGVRIIRTTKWINNRQWLLVAQQEEGEVNAPIAAATLKGMAVFAIGALIIVLAALFSTNHLVRLIRKTNRQREELNVNLIRASKLASLGEMATGLAHEINNPLGIILSEQTNISDLLKECVQDDPNVMEMFDSVSTTQRQVDRCKIITQKMLQFGRYGASEAKKVDVTSELTEIARLMEQHVRINNIDLCVEVERDISPITIDSTEFQQIVTNLINNAVQAIGNDGGGILLSAWNKPRTFHLTVEDTGPGIPESQKEKIFEPFFTTKAVGKGTGLGLSVCYGILANWRGKIFVEDSQERGGAFLHIELPLNGQDTDKTGTNA